MKKWFLPGIFGLLGTSFYVLGDTLLVGQALGRTGLASLNFSIPMINVMQGFGLLLGFGGATAMSRALGREDQKRAKEWAAKTVTWSIVLGFTLLLILRLGFKPLLQFLTGGGEALAGAESYLGILLWFSPCYVLFQSLVVLLRNEGATKKAMTALLLCSGLNILLDAIFLFVFRWGMFGAGLATGLAQLAGLILAASQLRHSTLMNNLKPRFQPPFRLVGKGLASFVMELSQGVVILFFNATLLALVGEVGVSSYAIIANLSLMFTAVFLGLAQGAQPLLAQAQGAQDEEKYIKVLNYAKQINRILSIIVVLLCLLVPQYLASLFISNDSEVISMTLTGLRLYGLGFLFLGHNLLGTLALQSKAESRKAFVFALTRSVILLLFFMLSLKSLLGVKGVWLSFTLSEALGFLWLNRELNEKGPKHCAQRLSSFSP